FRSIFSGHSGDFPVTFSCSRAKTVFFPVTPKSQSQQPRGLQRFFGLFFPVTRAATQKHYNLKKAYLPAYNYKKTGFFKENPVSRSVVMLFRMVPRC
ncbi:hypothetical protein QU755_21665, partial [Pseudomonas wenzhouensis]